jgi:hypothetical protein
LSDASLRHRSSGGDRAHPGFDLDAPSTDQLRAAKKTGRVSSKFCPNFEKSLYVQDRLLFMAIKNNMRTKGTGIASINCVRRL